MDSHIFNIKIIKIIIILLIIIISMITSIVAIHVLAIAKPKTIIVCRMGFLLVWMPLYFIHIVILIIIGLSILISVIRLCVTFIVIVMSFLILFFLNSLRVIRASKILPSVQALSSACLSRARGIAS